MGGVIIDDDMEVEFRRSLSIYLTQESNELLVTVGWFAAADYLATGYVKGSKQSRRAMPTILVGVTLGVSQPKRQGWLGTFQGLTLALFVNNQDHRLIGRSQVQARDVDNFFHEASVRGESKALVPVRLKRKGLTYPVHGGFGNAMLPGETAAAPVCACLRHFLNGLAQATRQCAPLQ